MELLRIRDFKNNPYLDNGEERLRLAIEQDNLIVSNDDLSDSDGISDDNDEINLNESLADLSISKEESEYEGKRRIGNNIGSNVIKLPFISQVLALVLFSLFDKLTGTMKGPDPQSDSQESVH